MTPSWPQIPEEVAAGVSQRWPDRAPLWIAAANAELHELCRKYDATPRTVLPARYGFVVAADTPQGGIVLRSSPDPGGLLQAKVATALAGLGVSPVMHETMTTDVTTWAVMDEVRPGTQLATVDRDSVSLDALGELLGAMRGQPAPAPDMPSVYDWIRDRLEDDNLTELPPWREPAPASERREALKILDELTKDAEPALCHGDASTWNILASGTARWLLIDPRGVSGEIAYDAAVLAFKIGRGRNLMTVGAQLSSIGGVEAERIHSWVRIVDAARV